MMLTYRKYNRHIFVLHFVHFLKYFLHILFLIRMKSYFAFSTSKFYEMSPFSVSRKTYGFRVALGHKDMSVSDNNVCDYLCVQLATFDCCFLNCCFLNCDWLFAFSYFSLLIAQLHWIWANILWWVELTMGHHHAALAHQPQDKA